MNVEVLKRAGLPSLKAILIQMNLKWLGHVERMDHNRLPRQLLYSQLKEGRRNQGTPRLRFKDMFDQTKMKTVIVVSTDCYDDDDDTVCGADILRKTRVSQNAI